MQNVLHSYSESKLDAEPWQSTPDLITRFYIDGCATQRAVALKRPIFKRKKGFANLSLGLIYHSKALPQPPSHDTVPLRKEYFHGSARMSYIFADLNEENGKK
jgi:hypothetical protein